MAHTVPIRWHHGIPITQADKGRFSMTVRDAWTQLQAAVAHGPVCLVQVQQVQGSAPREVGAWMAVSVGLAPGSLHGLVGSIGGGHLEYQAMAHAQQVLAGRQPHGVQRYALGPSQGIVQQIQLLMY